MDGTYGLKCAALFLAIAAPFQAQQQPSNEGTRQLYYLATAHQDALPPIAPPSTSHSPAVQPASKTEASHLGLRYNLVLVDQSGHRSPVRPDRVLHAGDCVGVDLYANRSGYVYVFAKQSNGDWEPLLPSTQMPSERNILDPGRGLQIPKQHCFRIEDPPGDETLFVVLSRNPRDFYELYEGYKSRSTMHYEPKGGAEATQLADNAHLKAAVEHLDEEFGTRNISITSVDTPKDANEPAGSVYVVNTSDRPTSSIVTKINIRHR